MVCIACYLCIVLSFSPYSGAGGHVSAHPWKPKEIAKPQKTKEQEQLETEWDDVLKQASEEELVDLAGR